MEDIEQKVTKDNITVYYQSGVFSAQIKELKIGKESIDVEFVKYDNNREEMDVSYQGIRWRISNFKGEITGIIPVEPASLKSKEATHWASANNELIKNSPERLNKAAGIWSKVYSEIMKTPLIQQYVKDYDDYLVRRSEELHKLGKEYDANRKKEKAELEKRFKNQPDPLDSLVNIVLA